MPVTLLNLRREIDAIRSERPWAEVIPALMKLFRERYEDFDPAARREADRIIDGFIEMGAANAKQKITGMEDGAEKRSLARMIARSDGTHVRAHDLVAVLEGKTSQKAPVVSESAEAFVAALQVCADFLFEARRDQIKNGKRDVVLHSLFMGLLDELLAAFHLAQRAFTGQAYAHVRTVEEVLEGIDVLLGDAVLFERWLAATSPDDERQVFKTVRGRVGQNLMTADSKKLFAFLSALGPHAQFRSVQARTALQEDEDGERSATVFFLGSPMQVETANVLTVRAAVALASDVARAFTGALLKEDADKELGNCRSRLAALVRTHLLPVAEQMQLTAAEVEQVLAHRVGSLTTLSIAEEPA
jgi:hypothetical protein